MTTPTLSPSSRFLSRKWTFSVAIGFSTFAFVQTGETDSDPNNDLPLLVKMFVFEQPQKTDDSLEGLDATVKSLYSMVLPPNNHC
jgi:hypothetical protein